MIDTSKLRMEYSHNGNTMPVIVDTSKGQDIEFTTTPPTEWVAHLHHPDIHECFISKTFQSQKERKEWCAKVKSGEVDDIYNR